MDLELLKATDKWLKHSTKLSPLIIFSSLLLQLVEHSREVEYNMNWMVLVFLEIFKLMSHETPPKHQIL